MAALDDLVLEIDFSTLLVGAYWLQRHCVVPDGFERGSSFDLVRWQGWSFLNYYRLRPQAQPGQLATAFHFRKSQIVMPQKAGKAPYTAAHVCVEAVGPALFAGWARGGELWDCRDHGCGCGWSYLYQPGEAMGKRWPTPLIQITAFSEKQTDNIYSALRPMIDDGPLSPLIPKTGEEMIRLPGNGRIDKVTSEARSRLGARVTFVPQDETGVWTKRAGMIDVAETQRRGLAGMGGRAEETTNGWDPNEGSVAQRTYDAAKKLGDIFRHHPQAPKGLSYRNKAERRKIHEVVYDGCRWIDLDGIEGESAEILLVDPPQAERFFGNRSVAGSGRAFDLEAFKKLALPMAIAPPAGSPQSMPTPRVPRGSVIVIGVDGARRDDALAVIATDVRTGYQWPLIIVERPADAGDDYEHDTNLVDGAVTEAFERFTVWRLYGDDQWIDHLMTIWTNRWGKTRIITWATYRLRWMAWAVREYQLAAGTKDFGGDVEVGDAPEAEPEEVPEHIKRAGSLSHNGDSVFMEHIGNAQRRIVSVKDDKEREMHVLAKDSINSPRKKDAADAAVISWKARSDALEKGVVTLDPHTPEPVAKEPERWVPGTAPRQEVFAGVGRETGPMGSMS